MGWSISLGRVKGTVVRLHLTFFLFLIWLGAIAYAQGGPAAAAGMISFMTLLFLCVVLHEFGHILAARQFGVHTPEVLLLPIGGMSKMERIPEEPRQELLIAIAGPAVSLAIALGLTLTLGGLPPPSAAISQVTPRAIFAQLAYANIVLFIFNLVPAFPLDGGRVLRAILAHFTGHLRATQLAATIGRVTAILLGLVALMMGHIILLLIAIFIFVAAGSEAGMAQMRDALFHVPAREIMIRELHVLAPNDTVAEAADELIRTSQTDFPVVDAGRRPIGLLNRDGIIKALSEKGGGTQVAEAMRRDLPAVSEWHRLDGELELLQAGKPVAVIDGAGRLAGLITIENLLEKLMIDRAKGLGRRPASVPATK